MCILCLFAHLCLLPGGPDVVEPEPDAPTYRVTSALSLEVGRADDNALISCMVDHRSLPPGERRTEQPLRVLFTPVVDIEAESTLPREGEKFYLQCTGNGNPSPRSYAWERKDGELPTLAKVDGAFLMFEMLNKSDNGVYQCQIDNGIGKSEGVYILQVQEDADPTAMSTSSGVDHAVIGGVVAVIVFILLCLLIVLGRYLIRHKGTYLTHEAKGSDDAPDADTAIINAEGGHSGAEDKKEYFI
ncbi:unnamed protein product [Gadus morhua 'NCC']